MKVWIPMSKGGRWWANVLSARYIQGSSENSVILSDFICFNRKKDAKKWIDDANKELKYPHEYDIVSFESK